MVDALTEIQRLLEPEGVLVDIHPEPTPMLLEVRKGDRVVFSHPELDFCADRYLQAQGALDEVVSRGLYALDEVRRFDYFVFGSSAAELRAYLEEANEFEEETEEPELVRRSQELESRLQGALDDAGPEARVATHDVARISRLRRIAK
jgi:hypothetical protein